MATSPDVAALTAYAGEHKTELFANMVNGMEAARHLTVIPNIKDKTPLIKLGVTAAVRPYNSSKQLESSFAFTDRMLETGVAKMELTVDPEAYRGTFLSKYREASALGKTMSFDAFVNEEIAKNFGSVLNDSVIFFGLDKSRFSAYSESATYAAGDLVTFTPSGGYLNYYICLSATTAGQDPSDTPAKWSKINERAVADGLKVHIDDAITATTLAETTIGEIDNSTVLALPSVRTVYRALPSAYRKGTVFAYMSYNTFDLLVDNIEGDISKYTALDLGSEMGAEHAIYVPGTNRKLIAIACSWMGESERIICTPKENVILGCDLLSDANTIATNDDLWTYEMGMKFNIGVNFANIQAVAVNDRD